MRAWMRRRPGRATRTLTVVALCLVAALVLVPIAKTASQVRAVEQFTVSDVR